MMEGVYQDVTTLSRRKRLIHKDKEKDEDTKMMVLSDKQSLV